MKFANNNNTMLGNDMFNNITINQDQTTMMMQGDQTEIHFQGMRTESDADDCILPMMQQSVAQSNKMPELQQMNDSDDSDDFMNGLGGSKPSQAPNYDSDSETMQNNSMMGADQVEIRRVDEDDGVDFEDEDDFDYTQNFANKMMSSTTNPPDMEKRDTIIYKEE